MDSASLNIVHVITTIIRGGAENHLYELVKGQIVRGHRVTVIYIKGDGYWAGPLEALGATVIALGAGKNIALLPLFRLRSAIRQIGPDILHAHMPPAELNVRLALLALRPAPNLIITKHIDGRFYQGPGQRLVGRWAAERAEGTIAISRAVASYSMDKFYIPADRMVVIHHGIDPRPYISKIDGGRPAVRAAWRLPSDTIVIGTVARLVPQKALHVLLNAFAIARARRNLPMQLVIVGRGPLECELRALADSLAITDEVVWAGFREDIPSVMSAFDVFALTSDYEGFGLVLVEAMAAALPVVATRVSAIPEIVSDGVTGILCKKGSAAGIADALLSLEDATTRSRLGVAGRERTVAHFNHDRMIDDTISFYRKCICRRIQRD
jgi:glycosyltransferase involved in cell wall biosynthesis